MSILIKGMDMPEHCDECKLKVEYEDETFCPFFTDNVEYWIAAGRRHEDCPLDPAQSHEKHGYWRGEYDGYADGQPVYDMWYCSECDYYVEDDSYPEYKYCPNCGTKMDEEDDDEQDLGDL